MHFFKENIPNFKKNLPHIQIQTQNQKQMYFRVALAFENLAELLLKQAILSRKPHYYRKYISILSLIF